MGGLAMLPGVSTERPGTPGEAHGGGRTGGVDPAPERRRGAQAEGTGPAADPVDVGIQRGIAVLPATVPVTAWPNVDMEDAALFRVAVAVAAGENSPACWIRVV